MARWRKHGWVLALALPSMIAVWFSLRTEAPRRTLKMPEPDATTVPIRRPIAVAPRVRPARPNPPARQRPPDLPLRCEPYERTDCFGGDVYWFDSCGQLLDLDEDCGTGFCRDAQCIPSDWTLSCAEPARGRCDGETLIFCNLGETVAIDCAANDQRCVRGPEGAKCLTVDPELACESSYAECDGQRLTRCVQGQVEEEDCAETGRRCVELPALGASCASPPRDVDSEQDEDCGACGCAVEPVNTVERCNGEDDDKNGFIDDGIDCGEVVVDVVVGPGDFGEPVIDEAGLLVEVAIVNSIFENSGSQMRFRLGGVVELDGLVEPQIDEVESPWVDDLRPLVSAWPVPMDSASDERSLREPAEEERFETDGVEGDSEVGPEATSSSEKSPSIHIQLVFVKELEEDGAPRLGVAFPFITRSCGDILQPGGRRWDRNLIAIAERRAPTTLAHEIGHMLGLCHTHNAEKPPGPVIATPGEGSSEVCGESCSHGGDAICDTRPDSEECNYDAQACLAFCPGGERPNTSNVMSYYHACRRVFSPEQVQVMEHTLALRRTWVACRGGACECQPGSKTCPDGMSCYPVAGKDTFACGMDGPSLPGGECESSNDCSLNSLCIGAEGRAVCARACTESSSSCSCDAKVTNTLSVCVEDLTAEGSRDSSG